MKSKNCRIVQGLHCKLEKLEHCDSWELGPNDFVRFALVTLVICNDQIGHFVLTISHSFSQRAQNRPSRCPTCVYACAFIAVTASASLAKLRSKVQRSNEQQTKTENIPSRRHQRAADIGERERFTQHLFKKITL